ncbi:MAG: ORF6N domain-containing protein [Planctomycetes bacterium]|nr:ORF6N domain-containing protein [Planctomycetota bacterium]
MAKYEIALPDAQVESIILTVRGHKVILDSDLAALYRVTTKQLNQQIKRHPDRFPRDFAFQLTLEETLGLRSQLVVPNAQVLAPEEVPALRSQIVTSNAQVLVPQEVTALRSQFATSRGRGGRRHLPFAFTEHGAIMAATVLNSPEAVRMSVFVVRAFVKMREALVQTRELAAKLAELERKLTERLDDHEEAIALILAELKKLMAPPPDPPKTPIGFTVRERLARYRIRRRKQCPPNGL